jgi:magnesium-protoporphyrin O-methyltransferase
MMDAQTLNGGLASTSYQQSRTELETYFDRTARKAWEDLTSDAPVSGIRATVRAGRDAMRDLLLSQMPADMSGRRLLDAGCGTGALAIAVAGRGADVLAIDVAQGLVDVAQRRAPAGLPIDWRSGDMRSHSLGQFDHVVAMDSLIHYAETDIVGVLRAWSQRTRHILFTFAPGTPLLRTMHFVGKAFPRSDRSPAILPVSEARLERAIASALPEWTIDFSERVSSGFYKSQAMGISRR